MKILKSWLKDYVDFDLNNNELASKLNLSGTEVEDITSILDRNIDSDCVLELEITANRGDCLSHLGIAREISALTHQPVKKEPVALKMSPKRVADIFDVSIENTLDCPRYFARMLSRVSIGPSPKWLQDRLKACGVTPINNIVDVTNYLMLDLGQPLHAFDADKIAKNKIIIRRAKRGEKIVTLDGEERALSAENLVIADDKAPQAIAGVIGGFDSQITPETKDIIIEAAEFNPKVIRHSSKLLNLATEASYRFERGIDSGGIQYAIDKAVKLMREVAGGEIYSGMIKAGETALHLYGDKIKYKRINSLLGLNLRDEEINQILKTLGFLIEGKIFTTPSWRHDIECWQDLAEEIGRIYGYEKIKPITLPKALKPAKSFYYFKEYLKDILYDLGVNEIYNYSFLSKEDLAILGAKEKDLLEIKNPIQPENKYLRDSLIPGILKTVAKNPSFDDIEIFEIGNIFGKTFEHSNLAIATSGKKARPLSEIIEKFCQRLGIASKKIKIRRFESADFKAIKIRKPLVEIIEIDLKNLSHMLNYKIDDLDFKVEKKKIRYRPISKFPSVTRDLAFIINANIKSDNLIADIYPVSDLINRVELFDEFASDKFGDNKKNLAFHIFFQAPDRTLNDNEINILIQKIIVAIEKKFKAKLR